MEEKKKTYRIKNGQPCTLPRLAGCEILKEAEAEDFRVLLCLCECGGCADAAALALLSELPVERVESALSLWRGAGVLSLARGETKKQAAPKETPSPEARTSEDIARIIREREFAGLIDAVIQQRGRELNVTDMRGLVDLLETLAPDGAYLLMLFQHCDGLGDGKPKPLSYIRRVADRFYEDGIDTAAALEAYLHNQEQLRSAEWELRRMFGIGERKLTKAEERAFLQWTTAFGYTADLIGAAYDITVNATGKAAVKYADSILTRWHESGVKTVADAEALIARERTEKATTARKKAVAPKAPPDGLHSSFDASEFFARAVARSFKDAEEREKNKT